MADIDDIPISDDDDSELDADSMSNREFDEIAFDVDNPLMSDYEFLGEETREIDGEEVLLIVPDAIANEDIFVAESDNLDAEEIEEIDNDSTAIAETIEEYDNTAVIPTIGAVTAGERVMVVLKNGVPTAMGSTGFGDDINLRVHEIEADYINTEVLEAERVRVNNLLATKADVSSLTAEQIRVDNLLADKASVSDLNAATGRIGALEADHVSTDDLEAVNGKITNLETNALTADSAVIRDIQAETAKVENLTAESLSAATGYIAALKSASIEASDISADHATIASINSDYIKTSDLEAERAAIDNLLADKADISDLTAATGRIDDLEADHVSTDDLEAEQIRVNNLLATKASVSDFTAEQARVNNLLAEKADISTLEAEYAHVTNGTIDNAKINHADVTGLNAEVANIADARISQATITQAQVQNLSADYAKITNGKINSALIDVAAIVDEQVFTVTGNKATIEEINADTITVRNLHTANLVVDSAEGYVTIGNKRTPTKEALDSLIGTLQNEIDGAVETFTSSAVPLLNNYPASDWQISGATAEEQRKAYAKHVGDICYVQNTASAQNGYAYRFAYDSTEQTFKWVLIKDSDVTKALGDISDLQTFESETNTWIEETDEGLRTIRENHTSLSGIVDKTLVSSTQLWFSKANTTAPNKPTAQVTSTSTAGNAWRTVVPAYNASYPNYFYCYQWKYADDTFGWSAVTLDIAMGESQAQARKGVSDAAAASNKATTAQNTANANIKSSVQLWFTKANNSAPTKPSSVISTNDAATGNAWNLAVPTYNSSYPHYFYCYQQQKGDGTYQWTDVVYDRATTENQAVARAALPSSTFETFRTTTFKEIVDTIDEQSTTITTLSEKTSTLANPNLTPWFSMTVDNTAYWAELHARNKSVSNAEGLHGIWDGEDGWAHVTLDARTSAGNDGSRNCYMNMHVAHPKIADRVIPGGTYTWLVEVKNLTFIKANANSKLRVLPSVGNSANDVFSSFPSSVDAPSGGLFTADGIARATVIAKNDFSALVRDTRGYCYINTGCYADFDLRISLYEGEYSGPYKPYVERLENITEISNTVNTVKQTADTNTASITNLTKTVSDNKTSIEQRASTIEQNLSGITTRVSKTESDLETVSNPNLSPFFSNQVSDIYNAETNPDGYWGNNLTGGNTKLSDGWTHYEFSNTDSSTRWLTIYEHCAWRHANGDLKGDTDYTVLMEFRNVTKAGNVTASGITTHTTSWPSMFRNTIDAQAITEGAELYFTGKTVSDPSAITGDSVSTRTLLNIPAGASISCDFRVSLYEGEYSGPYKPYVDQSLISRVSTAETSIKQHDDEIELRATKTELAKETRQRKGTYAECTTAAATANKIATISPAVSDFELYPGVTVAVCFTTGNNVASPKLNVNNTGLYPIVVTGSAAPALEAVEWSAWTTAMFTFDIRNQWRLVSTDEDVRRLTNAETKIEQNANAITLSAQEIERSMTFVPLKHDREDTWFWYSLPATQWTLLDNGWAHYEYTNSGTSAVSTYIAPKSWGQVIPGEEYTFLIEIKNYSGFSGTGQFMYMQEMAGAQFWGTTVVKANGNVNSTRISYDDIVDGAFTKRFVKQADVAHIGDGTTYDNMCFRYRMYIASSTTLSVDVRISVYPGDYAGPYNEYLTAASSAQLKVANDEIDLRVEKSGVIAAINASTESDGSSAVKISADKVAINGTAVFSAIEDQLNNTYDTKGAAATVQENLDNLQVGGRNLVWDTEWRDISNRWNVWGSPTTREIVAINGKRWLHLVTTTATFQGYQQNPARRGKVDPVNEIAPGDMLTVSFTAYAASAARWGVIGFHLTNASSIVKQEWLNFDITTTPQRFWASFTVPDNTDIDRFNIMIGDNSTQAHEVWISEVKLEKGSKATDWTPAPEDQTAYVDNSVNSIQIGGRNLLRRTEVPFSYAINTTSYGTHHLYSTGTADTAYDGPMLSDLGLNAGDEVTLSFDWTTSPNGSTAIRYGNFRLEFYGEKSDGTDGYITRFDVVVTMSASNSSGHYSETQALTTATVKTKRMVLRVDNSALVFSVSNVKLERGNKATDWSPAPEDTNDLVSANRTNLIAYNPDPSTLLPRVYVGEVVNRYPAWAHTSSENTGSRGTQYVTNFTNNTATSRYLMFCPFTPVDFAPGDIFRFEGRLVNWDAALSNVRFTLWTYNDQFAYITNFPSAAFTLPGNAWTDIQAELTIPTSANLTNTRYYLLSIYENDSTDPHRFGVAANSVVYKVSKNEQSTKTLATAAAPKADAIARSQRIYYRATSASGKPAENKTWLAASGTGYGNWSLNIPKLTLVSGSTETKYPFLYTAVQTQTVAQQAAGNTCSCTPVLIDETTTVIDGATIITGSVHANVIDANSGTFAEANIPNLSASKIQASVINAVNNGIGTINADKINVSGIRIGDLSGSIGGRNLLRNEDVYCYNANQNQYLDKSEYSTSGKILYNRNAVQNEGFYITNTSRQEIGESYVVHFDITDTQKVISTIYIFTDGNKLGATGANVSVYIDNVKAGAGNVVLACDLTGGATKHIDVYFEATVASTSTYKGFILQANKGTANAFKAIVTNLKWEKGNKPTDWSPAPEDQTAYVDNSVNGIQVGGRNLLLDTATFATWVRGNVNITGGQADPDGGNNAFLLTPTSGSDHYIRPNVKGHVPQLGEYTISVWLKASAAHTIYVTLENAPAYRIQAALTTEWQKFTKVVDITSLASVDYNFFVIGGYGSWPSTTPNVYIYHPKVEKGNRATDWSPAPEDISQMVKINTAVRNFTTAQWKSFGAVGHVENWTTGSSYNNSHIHVGDTAYLTGTVTDGVKGTATIIGTVTAVNGTTNVTMSSTQLIFGGDSVDAASKTATSYLTEGTSNGLMVHRSNDTTTGVKITDNIDIMRNGTSVAMFGTDGSGNALSRVGLADSGHTEQKSSSFDIYVKDEDTQDLLKAVSIHSSTSSGTLNTLEFYSEQDNSISIDAEDFPDDDVLGPQLYIGTYCDTPNRITGVTLQASAMTGSQYKSASIEIEVQQDGTREIRFGADDVWFNDNVIEGSAIASLPTSKLTGTIADTNLPIKDSSAGTAGTSSATSGATLEVPYVTTDAYGRVTAKGTHTHTIGSLAASAVTSGTFDAARIPSLNASKITAGTFNASRIPSLNASKINAGTFDSARLPTISIDKGGTGDTGVETVTAQATVFTSVTSGMTISNLTCATWGKMCMLSFTVKPSAAQTSAFVIGTLATAYRPVAVCTANPYHSSVATARIMTNGNIQMTAAPANEIPVSFTYLLA